MRQINRAAAPRFPLREARETPISLVLVEDHTVLRDGLKALLELESDVVIVGEFCCAELYAILNGLAENHPPGAAASRQPLVRGPVHECR